MNILLHAVGILGFLFIFWKRVKEDYISSQTFSGGFLILAGILLAFSLSLKFASLWWFWLVILGYLLGLLFGILKFNFKFTEVFEAANIGLMFWLMFAFLNHAITNSNLSSLIGAGILFIGLMSFSLLDKYYKRFSWYKSGRVGFSGFTVAGFIFLIRAVGTAFYQTLYTSAGRFDFLLSSVAAFIFFLLVYNLSRTET